MIRVHVLFQGKTELPDEAEMHAAIAAQHEFNRQQFTQVKRHALMVRPNTSGSPFSSLCLPAAAPCYYSTLSRPLCTAPFSRLRPAPRDQVLPFFRTACHPTAREQNGVLGCSSRGALLFWKRP